MSRPVVVFRTDASRVIGHGHVVRCMTLAAALRARGCEVRFVCREHDGHLCDVIEARGFGVTRLPAGGPGVALGDADAPHAEWLGATWQEDAEASRLAIETLGERPDWLVVDHYALDHRWDGALRGTTRRVMVVDDLADRAHDCDVLLDQNFFEDPDVRYQNLVPDTCVRLLGPGYALLQPEYADLHRRARPRVGPVKRLLVFFGGADVENLTGRIVSLVLGRPDVIVDVVLAAGSPHLAMLRMVEERYNNVHVHYALPTLAPLMERADLAIGAGGSATWERLCAGLPTIVVTLAENQRRIAEELDRGGLVRWLGHQDSVSDAAITETVGELLRHGLDERWSSRCLGVVDGQGVDRVCAVLTATATMPVRVRPVSAEDEALLFHWANDPVTRRNAFASATITSDTHRVWFQSRLGNPAVCRFYIVETTDGVPVGQVRFDAGAEGWVIDYAIAPVFRGRGLGRVLLDAALGRLRADEPNATVVGLVKEGNLPSHRVFASLGFEARVADGVTEYRRVG